MQKVFRCGFVYIYVSLWRQNIVCNSRDPNKSIAPYKSIAWEKLENSNKSIAPNKSIAREMWKFVPVTIFHRQKTAKLRIFIEIIEKEKNAQTITNCESAFIKHDINKNQSNFLKSGKEII